MKAPRDGADYNEKTSPAWRWTGGIDKETGLVHFWRRLGKEEWRLALEIPRRELNHIVDWYIDAPAIRRAIASRDKRMAELERKLASRESKEGK